MITGGKNQNTNIFETISAQKSQQTSSTISNLYIGKNEEHQKRESYNSVPS